MELVYPNSGIGGCEVLVVHLYAGVVVPESDVRHGHLDDGYETIMLAQSALIELCHLIERNVQAAPEAAT